MIVTSVEELKSAVKNNENEIIVKNKSLIKAILKIKGMSGFFPKGTGLMSDTVIIATVAIIATTISVFFAIINNYTVELRHNNSELILKRT